MCGGARAPYNRGMTMRTPTRPAASPPAVMKADGLVLDAEARTAAVSGRRIHLTRKEFDLLAALMRRPGKVLSVPFLLEAVWGYDPEVYSDPHTIGVHVSTLRRKVGARIGARIVNVPGLGYRFEP